MRVPEVQPRALPQAALAVKAPSVVLVLPYNPKMTPRSELDTRLSKALAAAEKKLLIVHPAEAAMPVVRKLQHLVRGLNSSTHKVGVALFASEDLAKVIYLEQEVQERIMVDEPFLVRDLADCKASPRDFLVLLLSMRESKMYWSSGDGMKLIKSNSSQNVFANGDQEVMLNKFLHFMDQGLGAVLKVYPLPVFVVATDRVADHFGRVTHNGQQIAGYIDKDASGMGEKELQAILAPLVKDWKAIKSRLLLQDMEKAAQTGKLVRGVDEVRKAVGCKNCRVIILVPDEPASGNRGFYQDGEIDELVEKVLENGGAAEKLDQELMQPYGTVAVIKYY
jgi:hypothetical protein